MSKFVLSVIGLSLVAVLAIYFFGAKDTEKDTTGMNGPVGNYELSGEKMDLGDMGVNDEKTATFTFKNTSSEKMSLGSFETSCNCTMMEVKMGGETSPMFNMPAHMTATERSWNRVLDPSETAEINVTYKPALMPVYGPIERYATFKINNSKEIRLTVSAIVK